MVDFDRTPWKNIHADLALYRFTGGLLRPTCSQHLVLMLHGPMTSHRTWDRMGDTLWMHGMDAVFAVDIADIQMGGSLRNATHHLREIVYWLLQQHDPDARIILIGHSTGGVLARRLLLKTPELAEKIDFLFSLGSPHTRTHFSYQVYVPHAEDNPNDSDSSSSIVVTPDIPRHTFMVNIFGNGVGQRFDGTVHGVYLPDAVNVVFPLRHNELKSHLRVVDEVLAVLRGERYRMQLFLQSLHMRTADSDNIVGPFYFEVNGMRTPFNGIFQSEVDQHYQFDDTSTPLATLAYAADRVALATTVIRLKDQSRTRSVRRRMFAKLFNSLDDNASALHEMQDNEGSKIALRVHTQRMPRVLEDA